MRNATRGLLLGLCLILAALHPALAEAGPFPHGSADTPAGTTLLFSVFASDPDYAWRPDAAGDQSRIMAIRRHLGLAAAYLEAVAAEYGQEAAVLWDFEADPGLCRQAAFDVSLTDEALNDEVVWAYLDAEIDLPALLRQYGADNCVFFVFLNTDVACPAVTCTRSWYEGMPAPYEIVYLYYMDSGLVNCPAVYAHELLHAFGAPDLYMEDAAFGIDAAFVAWVGEHFESDIMYNCSDPACGEYVYDRIANPVGELTAYYIGLTDASETAARFGLAPSEHAGD